MRKLNPITALYLKVLEFISFLLIEVGGRYDDYLFPKDATSEDYERAHRSLCRYRAFCRRHRNRY
jgi:hypothetical protein